MTDLADLWAEEQILGTLLLHPSRVADVAAQLSPTDFFNPVHARAFAAIESLYRTGERIDVAGTRARMMLADDFDPAEKMLGWITNVAGSALPALIDAIQTASIRRQMRSKLTSALTTLDDPSASLSEQMSAASEAAQITPATGEITGRFTFSEYEDLPDDLEPWVIPGMLRRGWRGIFVAFEGGGKSTILRQIALCVAQGIHPFFQSDTFEPVPTLIVDLENPREAIVTISRRIHTLACRVRPDVFDRDRAQLWLRPQGLDLRSRVTFAEFDRVLSDAKPGLVVLGPLYKAYSRGARESDEQAADELQLVLDELRVRHNFALLVEHHAPQGDASSRQMRPYGSSYWLRWPEFGFGLHVVKDRPGSLEVRRFRGDRVKAEWPDRLDRGAQGSWPWVGHYENGKLGHSPFTDESPF